MKSGVHAQDMADEVEVGAMVENIVAGAKQRERRHAKAHDDLGSARDHGTAPTTYFHYASIPAFDFLRFANRGHPDSQTDVILPAVCPANFCRASASAAVMERCGVW